MKAWLASLVALLFAGFASANVSGTGQVTSVPNLLSRSVGVSTDGQTANDARQQNEETARRLRWPAHSGPGLSGDGTGGNQ